MFPSKPKCVNELLSSASSCITKSGSTPAVFKVGTERKAETIKKTYSEWIFRTPMFLSSDGPDATMIACSTPLIEMSLNEMNLIK